MASAPGQEPRTSVGSADGSRLHGNAASHPLPEVLSKVHLGLREHLVYDGFGDPALLTAPAHKHNGHIEEACGGAAMPHPPSYLC